MSGVRVAAVVLKKIEVAVFQKASFAFVLRSAVGRARVELHRSDARLQYLRHDPRVSVDRLPETEDDDVSALRGFAFIYDRARFRGVVVKYLRVRAWFYRKRRARFFVCLSEARECGGDAVRFAGLPVGGVASLVHEDVQPSGVVVRFLGFSHVGERDLYRAFFYRYIVHGRISPIVQKLSRTSRTYQPGAA